MAELLMPRMARRSLRCLVGLLLEWWYGRPILAAGRMQSTTLWLLSLAPKRNIGLRDCGRGDEILTLPKRGWSLCSV